MRTKYIVGELPSGMGATLGAIVFPEYVQHDHMSQVFEPGDGNLVSAGFFTVQDGQVHVYGESTSLVLASREVDAILIAKAIGLHERSR